MAEKLAAARIILCAEIVNKVFDLPDWLVVQEDVTVLVHGPAHLVPEGCPILTPVYMDTAACKTYLHHIDGLL